MLCRVKYKQVDIDQDGRAVEAAALVKAWHKLSSCGRGLSGVERNKSKCCCHCQPTQVGVEDACWLVLQKMLLLQEELLENIIVDENAPKPEGTVTAPREGAPLSTQSNAPHSVEAAIHRYCIK